jgi:trigger factor
MDYGLDERCVDMKIITQSIESSQATLQIEVEAEEMEESLDRAYRQLVKKVAVPGFRKGKAPRSVLENLVGTDGLQREALEDVLPRMCAKAIEEQNLEVIAQPQIEVLELEPVVFKATFPLRPKVELGDYRSIDVAPPAVEVSDDEVETAMNRLRERHAVWSAVERPVAFEDLATVDVEEEMKETGAKKQHERQKLLVVKGSLFPLPGFVEHLEGMEKGEEREFALPYPSDYRFKELAGKEYHFRVKLIEIEEKCLPELNDDFVKGLGQSMEDVASLRESITAGLRKAAEDMAAREHERKVLQAVTAASKVEFPGILVDQETDSLLRERDMLFRERGGLQGYLKTLNKTEQEIRDEFRPEASRRVTESLVLAKVAEQEKIGADEAEVDAEIEKMVEGAGDRAEDLRKMFGTGTARHVVEDRLVARKTVEFLVGVADSSHTKREEKEETT